MDEYLDIRSLTLGELESIIDVARAQNKRNKNSPDVKTKRVMVGILNLSVSSILGRVLTVYERGCKCKKCGVVGKPVAQRHTKTDSETSAVHINFVLSNGKHLSYFKTMNMVLCPTCSRGCRL